MWALVLGNLSTEQSSLLHLPGPPRLVALYVTGANKGLVHKAEGLTQPHSKFLKAASAVGCRCVGEVPLVFWDEPGDAWAGRGLRESARVLREA